jgi:hypothetical protein
MDGHFNCHPMECTEYFMENCMQIYKLGPEEELWVRVAEAYMADPLV